MMAVEDSHVDQDDGEETIFEPKKYIVRKAFQQNVNGATLSFKAGQVVEDPVVLGLILPRNPPVDPVGDDDDLMICPHCHMASSRKTMEGAKALLRRAQQLMPGFR